MVGQRRAVDVEQALARFPALAGRRCRYRPLPGGLSHHVYLVDVPPAERYVLRVLDPEVCAAGLGIDPALEVANTRAAAGVGARVLDVLDDVPALLLEYLDGRTLSAADIPARLPAVAAACRRLHAGAHFTNRLEILAKLAELRALCRRHDLPLPDGYDDGAGAIAAVGAALAHRPLPVVPCHNDLLAANFIEQPDGTVRIVDYQLAGDNDPTFELGDIAAEADLDPDATGALAAAYFGAELTPALVARTRLNLILSNATWALWFVVYDGLLRAPERTFDDRAEAAAKWSRAYRDLAAPDFGALLTTAAGRSNAHHGRQPITEQTADAPQEALD